MVAARIDMGEESSVSNSAPNLSPRTEAEVTRCLEEEGDSSSVPLSLADIPLPPDEDPKNSTPG